ncbi:3722_t:CDS:2 [Entrophospora sp. SA101]|nr:3722_t:CDS:2 [Entrophospora sp. SA101]
MEVIETAESKRRQRIGDQEKEKEKKDSSSNKCSSLSMHDSTVFALCLSTALLAAG